MLVGFHVVPVIPRDAPIIDLPDFQLHHILKEIILAVIWWSCRGGRGKKNIGEAANYPELPDYDRTKRRTEMITPGKVLK